jgi:hypothetical protein
LARGLPLRPDLHRPQSAGKRREKYALHDLSLSAAPSKQSKQEEYIDESSVNERLDSGTMSGVNSRRALYASLDSL